MICKPYLIGYLLDSLRDHKKKSFGKVLKFTDLFFCHVTDTTKLVGHRVDSLVDHMLAPSGGQYGHFSIRLVLCGILLVPVNKKEKITLCLLYG